MRLTAEGAGTSFQLTERNSRWMLAILLYTDITTAACLSTLKHDENKMGNEPFRYAKIVKLVGNGLYST